MSNSNSPKPMSMVDKESATRAPPQVGEINIAYTGEQDLRIFQAIMNHLDDIEETYNVRIQTDCYPQDEKTCIFNVIGFGQNLHYARQAFNHLYNRYLMIEQMLETFSKTSAPQIVKT